MSLESASVVLTLVMPVDVEDALVETLLEHPDLAPGFTSQPVEGHGQRVSFIGTAEHVRGRAAYCRVQLVVPRADADTLLALLRERFATSRMFFWMVPAIASGRLA
ncbi:hypothetical protein ZRA01_05630 [Zoogloea ramigera]|uniref:DUF3240 domain-containing protein n=1 Tax=Zoogloea ramigera TaxID=350 RepID=A0A4Y4CV74_ZOORA|nr:DUF3240 family protein [Zoogloea ramigera]GEC94490.1 hypothetical protein ZRA01_05630 [Zoogloea ramigera]